MLPISNTAHIPDSEIEPSTIRGQGTGGQNVNKVSRAVLEGVSFDIVATSGPHSPCRPPGKNAKGPNL